MTTKQRYLKAPPPKQTKKLSRTSSSSSGSRQTVDRPKVKVMVRPDSLVFLCVCVWGGGRVGGRYVIRPIGADVVWEKIDDKENQYFMT